jgi:ribosomal protein S18 acetylase RimI-like enzyme
MKHFPSNVITFIKRNYSIIRPECTINIRHATRLDIPGIQSCNEKTLPENYPTMFYQYNLAKWPQLSLVAEVEDTPSKICSVNPTAQRRQLVGYVLGRMEDTGSLGRK